MLTHDQSSSQPSHIAGVWRQVELRAPNIDRLHFHVSVFALGIISYNMMTFSLCMNKKVCYRWLHSAPRLKRETRRFTQRRSWTPHFCRVRTQGGYDPQIRTRPRLLYNASTPKFHRPMFTRSESDVIVLTNKHTHKQTVLRRWVIR